MILFVPYSTCIYIYISSVGSTTNYIKCNPWQESLQDPSQILLNKEPGRIFPRILPRSLQEIILEWRIIGEQDPARILQGSNKISCKDPWKDLCSRLIVCQDPCSINPSKDPYKVLGSWKDSVRIPQIILQGPLKGFSCSVPRAL